MDSTNKPTGARVLVGRYRLGERIGRGGMGDVYRATDQVLARQVAVKLFRPNVSDEALDQRHESEARVLAGLNHPGLVSVYDIGTDDEQPFLVMELVEGETLADLVRRGPLASAQVASLGGQLAASLQAIHDAGVIHRDIKPANVLVCGSDDGAALRTKLTDFGIARLVDGTRLTSTGLLIGTVQYLSPEQTVGGTVSLPSDVYALGLVLLECLTGRAAFPGVGIETAVVRLSRQPEIPAELGPRWADVLGAMTAREPEQRPTAGEVASLLSALSAPGYDHQEVASVRRVAPAAAAVPAAAAAPAAGAAPGAAAVPGAGADAAAGLQARGGPRTEMGLAPAQAGTPRRRRRTAWSVSVGAAAALATAVTVAAAWSGAPATGEPAPGATSPAPSRTAPGAHAQTADPASVSSPGEGAAGTGTWSRHGGTTSAPDPGPSTPTASPTGQQSSTTSAPASAAPTTAPESSDGATTPAPSGTPGPDPTGGGAPPTGQATTPSPPATGPTPTTQPSPTSGQTGQGGKPDKPPKHTPKGKDNPPPGQPTGGPTSPSDPGSNRGAVVPVVGQP